MKVGTWKLVLLCAIGIYWSWFCHCSVIANELPLDLYTRLPLQTSGDKAIELVADRSLTAIDNNAQNPDYKSNGEWIGRLILPTRSQIHQSTLTDWVWIEIEHAPVDNLQSIGKTVILTWKPNSTIASDSSQVTTDIKFTDSTISSQQHGNIHPDRLNGRSHVGALQSLAGARSVDDVLVRLTGVEVRGRKGNNLTMTIDREPIQITGTLTGLVQILDLDISRTKSLPNACSEAQSCPNEYFRVRHYNPNSQAFDGQIETIQIPQISAKKSGLFPNTVRDLALSPAGKEGWYIYGNRDRQNLFTVAAMQPRSLIAIQNPQTQNLSNPDAKLDYLNRQHWDNTPAKKGQIERITFDRTSEKLGDKALVIHAFGGIGGKTGDILGVPTQTVTGHFAYGIATVVRDEFTNELQWSIEYHQVYAHNSDGIIAGKQDWATYMGQLQRGWLATRPVADVLISYLPVTEDYDFGGIKISPLAELERQLSILAARYRTGDGTGNASVTPATSCVQDSNQALYVTIRQLNREVKSQPQIQTWLDTHPQASQTLRFRELQTLGVELETNLAPLGIVREDWQQNAAKLAGTSLETGFTSSGNPILGLMSWRTMLPRGAQDGMAKIFSQRGAAIWFLNTYQVGGWNPDIFPIAPTVLFGQMPLLSTIVIRLWAGIVTFPNIGGWLSTLGLLIGYGLFTLPIFLQRGYANTNRFRSGFLTLDNQFDGLDRSIVQLFFLPALLEEILFRLLLLPHPIETYISKDSYLWSVISLGLFIIYHPFNALTFYKPGNPTFMDWRFLTLAGLLGIVCSIAYLLTGSIWSAVIIHWVVVVVWLKVFGGDRRLKN
jgi:predicted Abi (CAAX) family protease